MAAAAAGAPTEDEPSVLSVFQTKYDEFLVDIRGTFPELAAGLDAAAAIPVAERHTRYFKEVMKAHARPEAGAAGPLPAPGLVLPGVSIGADLWSSAGETTQRAVYEYLSILDLCALYECAMGGDAGDAAGGDGENPFSKEWADKVMRDWRGKLGSIDFKSMASKFTNLFGGESGALPPLPEKFLKGKLAKLAEDMVREFKPEDFGLRPEDIAAVEKDPTRAFEILMGASGSNPGMIQKAMARVGKKLQEKVQRGELRPQELVAEAEELMKEFQTHPAFVEMMESFRSAFSSEDPDLARETGRDGEGRLAIARARLRKKMEARRGGGGGAGAAGGGRR
jgi:hypothetical protein